MRCSTTSDIPPVIAPKPGGRWRKPVGWTVAGLVAGALVTLFYFNPAGHGFYPQCAFHHLTGLQCPGCGGLRALHHLLRGEVWTAFQFNPLIVLTLPLAGWFAVRRWCRRPGTVSTPYRVQARWGWLAFAGLLIFWIVRNLPLEMFRLPAG